MSKSKLSIFFLINFFCLDTNFFFIISGVLRTQVTNMENMNIRHETTYYCYTVDPSD